MDSVNFQDNFQCMLRQRRIPSFPLCHYLHNLHLWMGATNKSDSNTFMNGPKLSSALFKVLIDKADYTRSRMDPNYQEHLKGMTYKADCKHIKTDTNYQAHC